MIEEKKFEIEAAVGVEIATSRKRLLVKGKSVMRNLKHVEKGKSPVNGVRKRKKRDQGLSSTSKYSSGGAMLTQTLSHMRNWTRL